MEKSSYSPNMQIDEIIKEYFIMDGKNECIQRPKCALSPISTDDTNSMSGSTSPTMSYYSSAIYDSYDYIKREAHFQYGQYELPEQSTPTKNQYSIKRVNFHDVSSLAESSCSSSASSASTPHVYFDTSSGYMSGSRLNDQSSLNFANNQVFNVLSLRDNNTFRYMNQNELLKRKQRTQISREHREVLEKAYTINKYPDSTDVEHLSSILGFDENVIRIWFQNKRARDNLHKKSKRR